MERKVNEIITYNYEGETIHLKVTPTKDNTCQGCFFYRKCKTDWSYIKEIVGTCDKIHRSDNTHIIFKKVNNTIIKRTIDIYVVMQVSKRYGIFCDVFTSLEEAYKRFEELLKHYEDINNIKSKIWRNISIPSQIKVSSIKNVTLYLYKETKEIYIKFNPNEPIFD